MFLALRHVPLRAGAGAESGRLRLRVDGPQKMDVSKLLNSRQIRDLLFIVVVPSIKAWKRR